MQPRQANSQQNKQKKVYQDKNLLIIFAVSLIAVLGVASVTPAFPKLAQALDVRPQNIGLLVTVFTFPALALGPIIGVLADRLGRKKLLFLHCFCLGLLEVLALLPVTLTFCCCCVSFKELELLPCFLSPPRSSAIYLQQKDALRLWVTTPVSAVSAQRLIP